MSLTVGMFACQPCNNPATMLVLSRKCAAGPRLKCLLKSEAVRTICTIGSQDMMEGIERKHEEQQMPCHACKTGR